MSGPKGMTGLAALGGAFGVALFVKAAYRMGPTGTRRDLITSSGEYRMLQSEGQLEIRGLRNVGNSCFINAVLQSLASLPPFREYLEALSPPTAALRAERAQESPFTFELLNLMIGLRPERRTPAFPSSRILSPHKLRSLLRDKVDRFGKDDQQDAQELFQMVMRLVGEEAALCLKNRERDSLMGILETDGAGGLADLNPKNQHNSENDTPKRLPENPLSGSLAYVRRCTKCNYASTRVERFVDLSLTLPEARDMNGHHVMAHAVRKRRPVDLATILKEFTDQQLVEDVECPTCAVRSALEADEDDEEEEGWELPSKRVPANMRMLLGEAPKTLCLHFPRRHQSPSGLEMKLEQHVNFPLHLDVTPFCYTGGHHTDSIGLPTALQAHTTLASSLPQLPTGRKCKIPSGPVVPAEALSSPTPPSSPPMAKALQSPQAHPGVKQALVGGSVEGAIAGTSDGGRKRLNGLSNGVGAARASGGSSESVRRRDSGGGSLSGREGVDYDLRAVIVHQGSADNGHYTAFRKLESGEEGPASTEAAAGLGVAQQALRGRGGAREEDWVDISDETVKRVSVRDVLASQAYMLFYRRRRPEAYCSGLG